MFFYLVKEYLSSMNLDVDFLISFFKKNSESEKRKEMGEQDAASATGSSGGGKAAPKWADVVGGPKRGKANMLGKGGEKWETGMGRGVANQIW